MKNIWKYTLPVTSHPILPMQKGAKVLSVDVQHGEIQVWALVDPEAPKELRRFRVASTGNAVGEEIESLRFIGTVQMGDLVWHIFVHPEAES